MQKDVPEAKGGGHEAEELGEALVSAHPELDAQIPELLHEELSQGSSETLVALLNAVKLGLSLLGTVIVAFVIRLIIPRYLGPDMFGKINFADSFAASFFVFTSFGVDSYIRKEVATRIEHANDFWAGFWLIRLASTVVVSALMAISLLSMHKGPVEWRLVFIFALGQVAFVHNFTVAALLQAAGQVNELSYMNVVSKLIWGGGIWLSLVLGWSVEWVALFFLISEGLKSLVMSRVVQRRLNLSWSVDMRATWAAVVAALPYFLNYMCHRTYQQLNVTMLSGMTNDSEVGWYGASMNLASMVLLFLPILQAVLVPTAARIGKTDIEAMNVLMRNVVRWVVVGGSLISLIIMVEADVVVRYAFGPDFHESAQSLRMLAPMFPLTYLATLGAMHLIQLDRIWTMIKVSAVALVLNPLLNGPLIYWGFRMGPGWAGAMSALASICTEGANAVITFSILGSAAVDQRLWRVLGMTLLCCASVTGLHAALAHVGLWRIPVEVVAYLILAVATGALPLQDVRGAINTVMRGRRRR